MSNLYMSNFPRETPQSFFPFPEASAAHNLHEASFLNYPNIAWLCFLSTFLSMFYGIFRLWEKITQSLILPFLVGGVLPVLHTSMMEWWNPKSLREENLVPGHGQDFNTLLCTAWNEPKIALWNDWSRRHFVKNVGSYKMSRPAKKHVFYKMAWLTRRKSLQNASVCYKNAAGMEHESSHFKVEMYTGIKTEFPWNWPPWKWLNISLWALSNQYSARQLIPSCTAFMLCKTVKPWFCLV